MKNNRETRILLILLVFIICYGFFTYLLKPKLASNKELEADVTAEEAQVVAIYARAANFQADLKTAKEHKASLQKQLDLFYGPNNQQEEFIDALHQFFVTHELELDEISSADYALAFGNWFPGSETPYKAYYGEDSKSGDSILRDLANNTPSVSSYPRLDEMILSFKYEGTYDQVEEFFQLLRTAPKYALSNTLSLSMEEGRKNFAKVVETEIDTSISIVRPRNLTALTADPDSLEYVECTIPQDLADGSYRKMYSIDNLIRAIKGIFKR